MPKKEKCDNTDGLLMEHLLRIVGHLLTPKFIIKIVQKAIDEINRNKEK